MSGGLASAVVGALSALGEYGDALLSVFCDETQEREDFRVNLRR